VSTQLQLNDDDDDDDDAADGTNNNTQHVTVPDGKMHGCLTVKSRGAYSNRHALEC
jgi:hypothetical protein